MAKYQKKPMVVEASRWFQNGDHPDDGDERFVDGPYKGERYEGRVVRYFRHPDRDGKTLCSVCNTTLHNHGWIDGGDMVCPGDWIVKDEGGALSVCKHSVFQEIYEPVPVPE